MPRLPRLEEPATLRNGSGCVRLADLREPSPECMPFVPDVSRKSQAVSAARDLDAIAQFGELLLYHRDVIALQFDDAVLDRASDTAEPFQRLR